MYDFWVAFPGLPVNVSIMAVTVEHRTETTEDAPILLLRKEQTNYHLCKSDIRELIFNNRK